MPGLRELQMAMGDALAYGMDAAAFAVRGNGLAPRQRLSVYRNNVRETQAGALRAVYPVVEKLVGPDFFAAMAQRYGRAHPSASGNLIDFGGELAAFLEAFEPAAGLPYLPDVARLEWARHQCFHARADQGPPDLQPLARLGESAWGQVQLRLDRSARLLDSPWPVLRIWQVNQDGADGDARVDLAEGGARVLVLQRELAVEMFALKPVEYVFLSVLQAQCSLLEACDAALEADDHADPAELLLKHLRLGTLAQWSLPAQARPSPSLPEPESPPCTP